MRSALILAVVVAAAPLWAAQEGTVIKPPVAKTNERRATIHGETRTDTYYWLRDKTNPEVAAYLQAENAYADAVMKPTMALRETLYAEMLGRIKQTDLDVPYPLNGYYYYSRTEEGKQYRIHCRKRGSLEAPEEVMLDLNELAKGHEFLSLGPWAVTDDGRVLAYTLDTSGFREYELFLKDLTTGELLPDRPGKVRQVAWARDNRTLFYTTEDAAKRAYRVYRHTLGRPKETDALLYEERDELFRVSLARSRSRRFLFITSGSFASSEVRCIPADRPEEAPRLLLPREKDHEYYADHHGDRFYIRTNDRGRNFRLVTAPVGEPRKESWEEVVPHRDDVMLEGVELFRGHYVLREREAGLPKLRVTRMDGGESHYVEFPEAVYSAFPQGNAEFDTSLFRFSYQSPVTPSSVFDYDVRTRGRTLLKQTEVLGGYDPARYVSERIWATAPDGVRVPVSLVYRKDLKRDGSRPMLLEGYGAYGASIPAFFDSNRVSLLDRGVIWAWAHIRGGGEMGKRWHDDGKLLKKKNTFTDFIAAAEHLIRQGYTSRDRLAISGGSAGGLLMGAVVNMRPDLFRAVVSYVPFVDVINTMLDSSLPLTVGEYLEWGNPNESEAYAYMKSYCPYTNLEKKAYPAMLVRTSLNDSQVMYWEPAKYVAKLRTLKTDRNPLLLKTNMGAGHGGASGRYDKLRDEAYDYAFILTQLGIHR
jgi:oligopeptidase B